MSHPQKNHPTSFFSQGKTFEPHIVYPKKKGSYFPVVMVFHAWAGRDQSACKKAEQLAELGYIGVAVDLYGNAKVGQSKQENQALMQPFMQDREYLKSLILKNLEFVSTLPQADPKRIAAIGFCFGGLCALDLARSGAALAGVVSFHGLLNPLPKPGKEMIRAKILAFHGHDDPMVTPQDVLAFEQEMTAAQADWQMHVFGKTMHAFTQEQANDPDFGTVYQPLSDRRSWLALQNFLRELFQE